jgi:hypothetical protein
MGVLQDQIAAIRANDALTQDEKRAAIYQVKCEGLLASIISGAVDGNGRFIGKTFTFSGIEITIYAVGVTVDPNLPKSLVLDIQMAKGAETFRDIYYVTNPPVLAKDGTENLLQVAGEMVTSWWRGS